MRFYALLATFAVTFATTAHSVAAPAWEDDPYGSAADYIESNWETFDTTYSGVNTLLDQQLPDPVVAEFYTGDISVDVTWRDMIGTTICGINIIPLLQDGDYSGAASKAGDCATSVAQDLLISQLGLTGVSSVAGFAAYPVIQGINNFNEVAQQRAADYQFSLWLTARQYNSAQTLIDARPFDLIDAGPDLLTKEGNGWLLYFTDYLGTIPSGVEPEEFYGWSEALLAANAAATQVQSVQEQSLLSTSTEGISPLLADEALIRSRFEQELQAIPEPASAAILALGSLLFARRRNS